MATDLETAGTEWQRSLTFPPPPDFARQANANDPEIYARAAQDFEGFWADWAKELEWSRPWDTILE